MWRGRGRRCRGEKRDSVPPVRASRVLHRARAAGLGDRGDADLRNGVGGGGLGRAPRTAVRLLSPRATTTTKNGITAPAHRACLVSRSRGARAVSRGGPCLGAP